MNKKLLAIGLSVLMVLSLALPAYADGGAVKTDSNSAVEMGDGGMDSKIGSSSDDRASAEDSEPSGGSALSEDSVPFDGSTPSDDGVDSEGDASKNDVSIGDVSEDDVSQDASASDNAEDKSEDEADDGPELPETEADDVLNTADAGITDGWYVIESALSPNFAIDVADGSTARRAYLQLYKNNGTEAQMFYVKNIGGGRYTLRNKKSGFYMNVEHGYVTKGARIWQYSDDGTDAMIFNITTAQRDGYCTITNVKSRYVLDVKDAAAVKRTPIQIWRSNNTPAQMWKFVPIQEETKATLDSGYYRLVSSGDGAKVMDMASGGTDENTNVQIHKNNGTVAQAFYIENKGNDTYSLLACNSGKMVTAANNVSSEGANVLVKTPVEGAAQLWTLTERDGKLRFTAASDASLCLTASASTYNVSLEAKKTDNAYQLWEAQAIEEPQVLPTPGAYIISLSGINKVLDVVDGSVGNAAIQLYKNNGTEAQKFLIAINRDGSFAISNCKSFMTLDVAGASSADGTRVTQHKANADSDAQVWYFKGCPGRYRIVSACGGKVLTVSGGSAVNRAGIVISTDKNDLCQRFTLTRTVSESLPLDKQVYRIVSSKVTYRAIDVPDANYAEGLLMRIHNSNYTEAQKWQFIDTGDGSYVIMNAKTGLCLTAKEYGGSTWGAVKRTTVIQYNEIESDSYKKYQRWTPVPAGDGGYYFRNAGSGLYLDIKGGSIDNDTPLQVYPGNQSEAQKFYLNRVSHSSYLRWHGYASDSKGTQHWLEGTFWDDPKVSDTEFLAAAMYTEGGSQGVAGMMMIGYSMLNRTDVKDLRYIIYTYGQYEICRDGALTRLLTDIKNGNMGAYSKYPEALQAAKNCMAGKPIVLETTGVMTYPGGAKTLTTGMTISKNDFVWYDGFMTPAAFSRHGFTTANNHTIQYKGHIYYNVGEIWK